MTVRGEADGLGATAVPAFGPDTLSGLTAVSPSGVQLVITRIRFSVRAPVLSVQVTPVDPRVSTADRRLTERRSGPLADPTASASVMVGSSPSGMFSHQQPDRETGRGGHAQPGGQAGRQERDPGSERPGTAISQVARLT
jgi:hypothetical protein